MLLWDVCFQPPFDLKIPIPSGATRLVRWIVQIPQDFRATDQLQRSGSLEVEKNETGVGVDREVPQGVVFPVE